jgi:antitoxin (DNA-binding transcriptional repressor) of toxin-antitoxin stability system
MVGERAAGWIDADRLPEDLVALIDALAPGENLLITRNGKSIASISSTPDTFDPGGQGDWDAELPSPTTENVKVVATAMKLSASARASLSAQLGPEYIVLDLHSAPKSADVVLAPPISPQLTGSLRSMFPKARVIITELEDEEFGISYQGPVRRLLDAGADAYLPPSTIPRLAMQLNHVMTNLNQITGTTGPLPALEPLRDHDVLEGE